MRYISGALLLIVGVVLLSIGALGAFAQFPAPTPENNTEMRIAAKFDSLLLKLDVMSRELARHQNCMKGAK